MFDVPCVDVLRGCITTVLAQGTLAPAVVGIADDVRASGTFADQVFGTDASFEPASDHAVPFEPAFDAVAPFQPTAPVVESAESAESAPFAFGPSDEFQLPAVDATPSNAAAPLDAVAHSSAFDCATAFDKPSTLAAGSTTEPAITAPARGTSGFDPALSTAAAGVNVAATASESTNVHIQAQTEPSRLQPNAIELRPADAEHSDAHSDVDGLHTIFAAPPASAPRPTVNDSREIDDRSSDAASSGPCVSNGVDAGHSNGWSDSAAPFAATASASASANRSMASQESFDSEPPRAMSDSVAAASDSATKPCKAKPLVMHETDSSNGDGVFVLCEETCTRLAAIAI